MLLDDHVLVREGLRALVAAEEGMEVVAEASDLSEAMESSGDPDLILADLRVGGYTSKQVIGALKDKHPRSKILVVTMVDDPKEVHVCLVTGANGYMLKQAAATDLIDAVKRVMSGQNYLQPSLGATIVRTREPSALPGGGAGSVLTAKEQEVLKILALGHTNAEAAEILSLAVRTVEAHRAHIMEKLGVRTRAEMVRYAIANGLVDLRDMDLQNGV
ncbi:MAG: LuxR C-terminal-related transcriptional regulator, partial [Actinomycetota bacterium]